MKVRCTVCGKSTAGIKEKGSATQKRVTRKFGCVLCSHCLRLAIMEANRVKEKRKSVEDVHITLRKYVQNMVA